jgi:hypothetical protein
MHCPIFKSSYPGAPPGTSLPAPAARQSAGTVPPATEPVFVRAHVGVRVRGDALGVVRLPFMVAILGACFSVLAAESADPERDDTHTATVKPVAEPTGSSQSFDSPRLAALA